MCKVLRLDLAGRPTAWLTREEAAVLYVKKLVQWELGERAWVLRGGKNRLLGQISRVDIRPVIATKGDVFTKSFSSSFNNRMLFKRDNYQCMYCGIKAVYAELTRDHIVPWSKGGEDRWENVVAACKRCNQFKADRTPEQAGLTLLAIPFKPNAFEAMFLAQHRVLDDQMMYLAKQFSGNRAWAVA